MATKVGSVPAVPENKGGTPLGPYRATKLWNDVIRTFRTGMPVGRHRRYMKSYDECFVGSEAVTWLQKYLQDSPKFGPCVTRGQTTLLLEKLQKTGLFQDVRGAKGEPFGDNGRLYRFTHNSPIKPRVSPYRQPLAPRLALMNKPEDDIHRPIRMDVDKMKPVTCIPRQGLPECRLVAKTQLSTTEVETVWKGMTLNSLSRVLEIEGVEEIMDPDSVNGSNILHNMTHINKNGVVTNIDKKDQLPHWVLSAMRCLAYWPEKVEGDLPQYPGFEKDVFGVIKSYFEALQQPLTTFDLYEVFINAFVCLESLETKKSPPSSFESFNHRNMTSAMSVENLMADLTMNARRQNDLHPSEILIVHDPDVLPGHQSKQQKLQRWNSSASLLNTRIETSFGVDNSEPCTHIYINSQEAIVDRDDDGGYSTSSEFAADIKRQQVWRLSGRRTRDSGSDNKAAEETTRVGIGHGFAGRRTSRRCTSTTSIANRTGSEDRSGGYGLTVALSSMPRADARDRRRFQSCGSSRQLVECRKIGKSVQSLATDKVDDSSEKPPPYVPPPSYNSLYKNPHSAQSVQMSRQRQSDSASLYSYDLHSENNDSGSRTRNQSCASTNDILGSCKSRGRTDMTRTQSGSSLAQSYRMAVQGYCEPVSPDRRTLFGSRGVSESLPDLLSASTKSRAVEALQILLLLLPPADRRKLHLLLRLMNKMSGNNKLCIDDCISTKELVLQTFSSCILAPRDNTDNDNAVTVTRLVSVMMESYSEIMKLPSDLKSQVEDRIAQLKRIRYVWDEPANFTYCAQVSHGEYNRQRLGGSQQAMEDLLEEIIQDKSMSSKDKKKRLKQFQKTYPEIYAKRFPPEPTNAANAKPRIKPPLFSRPLQRLKNFRL